MEYFYIYILRCSDNTFYVGHTDNLEKRIAEHQDKIFLHSYTASRLPVKLVFSLASESREEAFLLEHKIKKWSQKKKAALINGNYQLLSYSAKKKF